MYFIPLIILQIYGEYHIQLSDEDARIVIKKVSNGIKIPQIRTLPKKERDNILKSVKSIEGITQRQAARLLGILQYMVFQV